MAQTYTIVIDEAQRKLIERTMQRGMAELQDSLRMEPSSEDAYEDDALDETHNLLELFKDLPADEDKHPGIIHGFCL